jgi:dCTP diphosphatase
MTDSLDIDLIKKDFRNFVNEREWSQYQTPKNIAMAMSVEASEIVEIFQWLTEQESFDTKNNPEKKQDISYEIADVILYLIRLSDLLDINIAQAVKQKFEINKAKYPVDKVKGSSKKYTEYVV